eukprot:jgi/Pico_ML_1/51047/g2149.t1
MHACAHQSSFMGAVAVSDLMKSTLGPKGMDKILQSVSGRGDVQVTNDGATILQAVYVDNPAAKLLVDISKAQDDEVGDGTTSVVVLAGELLKHAESLLLEQKLHPMTVVAGYRTACQVALESLADLAVDHAKDQERFRKDLFQLACTTLSSKILTQEKIHFAELAVQAVLRLKGKGGLDAIQVIKVPGGSLKDSFLDDGFLLDKKLKFYGARVRTESLEQVGNLEAAEKAKMKDKCQAILDTGATCFVNRQLIYNYPEELFADAGIMAIEHADFDGIERLALVTGGEIASHFGAHQQVQVRLGTCDLVEEVTVGEKTMVRFSGVPLGEACTVVLRGSSSHVLDEAERSLHDALCVLKTAVEDSRVVCGGGCPEVRMALNVERRAKTTPGKAALAMEAYAKALLAIPTTICDNAGLDAAQLITQLRSAHAKDLEAEKSVEGTKTSHKTMGVDVLTGTVGDMEERGVYEAYQVKKHVVLKATEAAEMLLRVDEIVKCAPRVREE